MALDCNSSDSTFVRISWADNVCCIRHMRHGPLLGTRVPRCSAPGGGFSGRSGLWPAGSTAATMTAS